jgi:hypothetical protein
MYTAIPITIINPRTRATIRHSIPDRVPVTSCMGVLIGEGRILGLDVRVGTKIVGGGVVGVGVSDGSSVGVRVGVVEGVAVTVFVGVQVG